MNTARLGWATFFVAAGVLGFEISLMRVLLAASWHHFAFLVISVALLGFGASGTVLSILRSWVVPRSEGVFSWLTLSAAASIPICIGLAQHIPAEARFAPSLMWQQIGYWLAYWALLGIPFLLGAGAIGLALMTAGQNLPRIYAANLLGSAAGVVLATVSMSFVPPAWLAPLMSGLILIGVIPLRTRPRRVPPPDAPSLAQQGVGEGGMSNSEYRVANENDPDGASPFAIRNSLFAIRKWIACVGIILAYLAIDRPHVRVDPYKYGAYVARLTRQGAATRVAARYGPRAVVQAYRGDAFHDLPFLSGPVAPPSITVLVADGHYAGSVLEVDTPAAAAVVDHTVMAFPYTLIAPGSRVLLLGETGGGNVWLARRHHAASIRVVQPDANIVALHRGPLRQLGGAAWDAPGVLIETAQPRHFVQHSSERFDLIQLVTLESSAAGSGGMGGLGQDHLITVEGIAACLERLSNDGLLAVTRGIQTPPRDNLKLLTTFTAALRETGVVSPGDHMAIVRDFLGVCTMVKASPWTSLQVGRIRRMCAERELTPVWFPGIRANELNKPDALPGPAIADCGLRLAA